MEAEPTPLSEHERLKAMVHDLSLRLEDLQQGRKRYSTTVVNQTSSASSAKAPYWSCDATADSLTLTDGTGSDWDAILQADTTTTKQKYEIATGSGFLFLPLLSADYHNRAWLVFENSGAAFDAAIRIEAADGGAAPGLQIKLNESVTEYLTPSTIDQTVTWNIASGRNRIALTIRGNGGGGLTAYKYGTLKCKFLTEDNVSWVDGNE